MSLTKQELDNILSKAQKSKEEEGNKEKKIPKKVDLPFELAVPSPTEPGYLLRMRETMTITTAEGVDMVDEMAKKIMTRIINSEMNEEEKFMAIILLSKEQFDWAFYYVTNEGEDDPK